MEVIDKRKFDADGEPTEAFHVEQEQYDAFKPTLAGCIANPETIILRELKMASESQIVSPDAYAEPCDYGEVISSGVSCPRNNRPIPSRRRHNHHVF